MARTLFEFHCQNGCGGFMLVPLEEKDERDIILVCPACKHEHFRGMKHGEITQRRHAFSRDSETVHRIEPTMAAFSKTSRVEGLVERGFLGDLWARFARGN